MMALIYGVDLRHVAREHDLGEYKGVGQGHGVKYSAAGEITSHDPQPEQGAQQEKCKYGELGKPPQDEKAVCIPESVALPRLTADGTFHDSTPLPALSASFAWSLS
jgi:hypothetical protein